MEETGGNLYEAIKNPVRKKRSYTFRRSHSESQHAHETNGISSFASTPTSEDVNNVSSDDNMGIENDTSRKEVDLDLSRLQLPPTSVNRGEKLSRKAKKEGVSLEVIYGNTSGVKETCTNEAGATADRKTYSMGVDNAESHKYIDPNNSEKSRENCGPGPSGASNDGFRNEGKVKKVKLKVGGVTRTIDASANSPENCQPAQSGAQRRRLNQKDGSNKGCMLKGIPWKDFPSGGFTIGKEGALRTGSRSGDQSERQGREKSEPARKSRRPQKKRVHGDAFDDDGEDDEIRYLEKLRNSRSPGVARCNHEDLSKKSRRLSKLSGEPVNQNAKLLSGKEGKQNVSYGDTDYDAEDDPLSDGDAEGGRNNKSGREFIDAVDEPNREMTLTTRQRALQSKDASAPGGNMVEYPNGLPPAPPRKQKEKLTDVELQLKKAEAAHRRKLQNEKAARACEAEAIRKILGQDSNRKKREEKKKKRQEELAQEKAANAHAANTVRWIMGPNGTTVVFPKEMGLPGVFDPRPSCYPPPREKCAGPSCTNPYKYRDSRSKLPLCSLGCYKAVQAKDQPSGKLGPACDALSAH